MGGNSMSMLNVEIIEYVSDSNLDDDVKDFIRWAIMNEIKNSDSIRYKQSYENQFEKILGLD